MTKIYIQYQIKFVSEIGELLFPIRDDITIFSFFFSKFTNIAGWP